MKSNISAPDMFKTLKDTRGGKHIYSVEDSFSGLRKLKTILEVQWINIDWIAWLCDT